MELEELRRRLAAAEAGRAAAVAGTAAAVAGWAEAEAGRAEAEARRAAAVAALAASLGALALAPPPGADSGGGGSGPGVLHALVPASLRFPSISKLPPSAADASCFLATDPFVGWLAAPVTRALDPTLAPAFARLMEAAGDARGMGAESRFYALATSVLPPFAERVGEPHGDAAAVALLLGPQALGTAVWAFPGACKPGLHVRGAAGGAGQPPRCPGFSGELKTASDGRALEQAAYYATMDMVRIFFPAPTEPLLPLGAPMPPLTAAHAAAAAAAQHQRHFYAHPPMAYALVGFPYAAHLLCLEWVGKVLVSPASQPFFLGSPQHAAAVAALPAPPYAEPEVLDLAAVGPWLALPSAAASSQQRRGTAFSLHGGLFRKLVPGSARTAPGFAAMHAANAALASVLPRAPLRLRLPARARLLYGAHEVLVELPAVPAGRAATEEELATSLLPALARAIAWLARAGVVYTDLRAPNVVVGAGGEAWLVDFDDCVVVAGGVGTVEGYVAAVAGCPGAAVAGTFAASLCAGGEGAVEAALRVAFAQEAAEAATEGGGVGVGGEP
jgi:hypothetical protein